MPTAAEWDILTPMGICQAERLAQRLASEFWQPSHLYSSNIRRCRGTTDILRSHLPDLPVPQVVAELREIDDGILSGLTWAEAVNQYPDLCQALASSADWLPIPQAESPQAVRDRAHRFIQHVFNQHQSDDRLWVITHAGILQHLIAELMGSDRSWQLPVAHTGLFEFWLDVDRLDRADQNRYNTTLWQIRRFNDDRHLQDK